MATPPTKPGCGTVPFGYRQGEDGALIEIPEQQGRHPHDELP